MQATRVLNFSSSSVRSGTGSICRKRYWELYAREIMSKQTAGMASCDIENEGENIVDILFYRLCYCKKVHTHMWSFLAPSKSSWQVGSMKKNEKVHGSR